MRGFTQINDIILMETKRELLMKKNLTKFSYHQSIESFFVVEKNNI
jgi:hypothetical protein